jgi:dihydroorotate dehydrogenase electron transfer subunit
MSRKVVEEAEIRAHTEVAPETFRLRLASPRIAAGARAGGFVMLQVDRSADPLLRRPFSFHRIYPESGEFEILYRVVGRGTLKLSRHQPGERLSLVGPLGNGFSDPPEPPARMALIAGGIGIAPLFELLAKLRENRGPSDASGVKLFYGARTAAELVPQAELAPFGAELQIATDDGTGGCRGFVTQLFEAAMERESSPPARIYACGPLSMQYRVAAWAVNHCVPAELSLESLMACGVGACLGCALPAPAPGEEGAFASAPAPAQERLEDFPQAERYVHVCKDGPIFDAGAIEWRKIPLIEVVPPTFQCS